MWYPSLVDSAVWLIGGGHLAASIPCSHKSSMLYAWQVTLYMCLSKTTHTVISSFFDSAPVRYQLTTSAHNVQALNNNLGERLTRTSANKTWALFITILSL